MNYEQTAKEARKRILKMIYNAQVSHIGSNFSILDVLSVLFTKAEISGELNKSKDIIIASKGWCAASVYYFLAKKGLIPESDLDKFCDGQSPYIGLVEPTVPGIFAARGSMGYGLSFGVAFAWDKKDKGEDGTVYVIMSDGEQAMGQNYEAARVATHYQLNNLVAIIDYNKLQAMGKTNEILNIEPLRQYWETIGWKVKEIDGHNYDWIENALDTKYEEEKPYVIIANTHKGYPISFMTDNNLWHYSHVNQETLEKSLEELR